MNSTQCVEFSNSTVDQAIQNFNGFVSVGGSLTQRSCPAVYPSWYPSYWYFQADKTSTAMKVIKHLMDKKAVNIKTIPEFVSIVDEIAKIL